jgi:hypothetical protein
MQQQHEIHGDIKQFLQSLHSEESTDHEADMLQEEPPQSHTEQGTAEELQETIHVYFVREPAAPQQDEQVIESIPPTSPQRTSDVPASTAILFGLVLILSCLAFQLSLVFHPPTVTITVVPRSQTVTLSGALPLGRLISAITLSQSQTVPTTGKGHQDAKPATGTITLYNGQFNSVTVAAGTLFTGNTGIEVVTDQDATIPAGNPPAYGQVTVSAHTRQTGPRGNIQALDIQQACCAPSVLVKNLTAFRGGQDEQDFHTVAKSDIETTASTLQTTLARSVPGALQGQLTPHEQLQVLPCTPTVAADHHIGQEATAVTVTLSETCRAVAYHTDELVTKATALLSSQARQTLGTGYRLVGTIQVTITQAAATPTIPVLIFSCQGTWVYALSQQAQQQMKHRIAGKSRQEAIKLLVAMPGIETATIERDDQTKLPKSLDALHLRIIVPQSY